MHFFRNLSSSNMAEEEILNQIDYLKDTDLPKSDVLQFDFNNMHLLLRPSGTEPKIKYYIGVRAAMEEKSQFESVWNVLQKRIDGIAQEMCPQ